MIIVGERINASRKRIAKALEERDAARIEKEARRQAETVVNDCINEIRGCGVGAEGTVRQGDRSSELLKYLAEHQPFQAVVWGGNETFLRQKRTPVRTHWLERVREQLDCTLVVPSLKREKPEVR